MHHISLCSMLCTSAHISTTSNHLPAKHTNPTFSPMCLHNNPPTQSHPLPRLPAGVQRKGERLSAMIDGVLPTRAASIYRVHSASGQVEFRLVDMLAAICSCPNKSSLMCSHAYAACLAQPQHRLKVAFVLKVGAEGGGGGEAGVLVGK